MREHTFTLRFLAPGQTLDELSVRLYQQVHDASLTGPGADGSFRCEFDRIAPNLPEALASALREIRRALPEIAVLRVEAPDLVSMGDIAARSGRTPESVRLLIGGQRGPGGFPPEAGRLGARTKVWRLADVADWFRRELGEPLAETAELAFLRAFNDALEIHRLAPRLSESEQDAVAIALGNRAAA